MELKNKKRINKPSKGCTISRTLAALVKLNNIGALLYKQRKKQQALEKTLVLVKQMKFQALIQALEEYIAHLKQ